MLPSAHTPGPAQCFRTALLLAVLGLGLGAAYGNRRPAPPPKPAPAPTLENLTHGWLPEAKTNVAANDQMLLPPPNSEEINPSLVENYHLIASSNLLTTTHPNASTNTPPTYVLLLNLARQQRAQKNYSFAIRHYASILESGAPEDYQRTAMVEMALANQEANQPVKALQVFAQYLQHWPQDPAAPEIMLRQGLLYRQIGASTMALAKFYSVMTSALTLKNGSLAYYKRLVLHAQAEISDTYYLEGKFDEAVEYLNRLLKQDAAHLNRPIIQYKLIRSLAMSDRHNETIAQAREFLDRNPQAPEAAEVRFLLAKTLKQNRQNDEALRQVMLLLKSQQATRTANPTNWVYWQLRAGNEIGNRLYLEGDYLSALQIYATLAELNPSPAWQLPVLYQVGLVYERLEQPEKAAETYRRILAREKELAPEAAPGLKTVMDMAKWRNNFLSWQVQAERSSQTNYQANAFSPAPATP